VQLRSFLTDPSNLPEEKKAFVDALFGRELGAEALSLLTVLVQANWSTSDDLLAGIEEIALRVAAITTPAGVSVENELFEFGTIVSSNAELELALNSTVGSQAAKLGLVNALLSGKAAEQTVVIVRHLVHQPRGRRIAELLSNAASIVADQSNLSIATVTSAATITSEHLTRLQNGLARRYGRQFTINQVIDPGLLGGLRVQVGDEVIDGSIEKRINELRLQLAG